MRVLIDTNIFLEIILGQEKSAEAGSLLERVEDHEFFITDYSSTLSDLYSSDWEGINLSRTFWQTW